MSSLDAAERGIPEWHAWRHWCQLLKEEHGVDVNEDECSKFVNAVKLWGEELTQLRLVGCDPDSSDQLEFHFMELQRLRKLVGDTTPVE